MEVARRLIRKAGRFGFSAGKAEKSESSALSRVEIRTKIKPKTENSRLNRVDWKRIVSPPWGYMEIALHPPSSKMLSQRTAACKSSYEKFAAAWGSCAHGILYTLYDIFCQVKAIFSDIYTHAKVQVNQVIKTTKEFIIFCTVNIHKNVDIIFVSIVKYFPGEIQVCAKYTKKW